MTIPPVSFAAYDQDFAGFSERLGASFERWGFAVVSDPGLEPSLPARALEAARTFFALPEAVKRRHMIPGGAGQRGYTPFGVETAKGAEHFDLKEFWHVGRELPQGHPYRSMMADNVWPEEIPAFRPAVYALFQALETLGQTLLRAISRHLGLPDDYFEAPAHDGNSILRLLHYPPASFEGPNVRAEAHEDINAITLLLGAEEAGLQILDRDGRWVDVNPPAGAVVCNIGDMLQRLTNHVLPSTTHRVVNPEPDRRGHARYSMPFFLHFAPDFLIKTLPECIGPGRPDRYPAPVTAQAYLQERLREIRLSST